MAASSVQPRGRSRTPPCGAEPGHTHEGLRLAVASALEHVIEAGFLVCSASTRIGLIGDNPFGIHTMPQAVGLRWSGRRLMELGLFTDRRESTPRVLAALIELMRCAFHAAALAADPSAPILATRGSTGAISEASPSPLMRSLA